MDEIRRNEAEPATIEANRAWYDELDFDDENEKACAEKGLIEAPEAFMVTDADGNVVWDVKDYDFMREMDKAPDTVNPSLWRNTLYNSYAGLFEVCDGIYQVRGYDMANATFIRTEHGWIVFDVLMCEEDMADAKALMEKHFGKLNVVAVMYSHSHIDHYGGIYGLISKDDVADDKLTLDEQLASGKVAVLAPEGFLKHAVSENIYAGPAMGRRAMYQYGTLLKPGEKGRMSIGIGLGQAVGKTGLVPPTYEVCTDETLMIDGLEIQFQLTPGTEAPVEMNAYFPAYRGLWLAENCTGTMHNLYTLRGAQVRNADDWARYILEAEQKFADVTDVVFQSHNWPHWETAAIKEYMENTAAVYKFINDQTLHYINLGYTSAEISHTLKLPEKLNKIWYTRQYYGTLSHNIKAVYQKYMGWYDANPVNLDPLPPEKSAKKLLRYLIDPAAVLKKAREDYAKGDYQWVAQITRDLVFADPSNMEARLLCADALEQLGYQAESGTWRNAYLTGALELRTGNQANNSKSSASVDGPRNMSVSMMLDYIDICTDAIAAQDDDLTIDLCVTDTDEKFHIVRKAGVLLVYKGNDEACQCGTEDASGCCDAAEEASGCCCAADDAGCSLTCTKAQFAGMMLGDPAAAKAAAIDGDPTVVTRLFKYMVRFTRDFNIVEP